MNYRIAKKILKNLENPKLNMRGEPKLKHSKHQIEAAKRTVRKAEKTKERRAAKLQILKEEQK